MSRSIARREASCPRSARRTHRLAVLRLPGHHRGQPRRDSAGCREPPAIKRATGECSRPPSSQPTASPHPPPSSEPTESEKPERKTLPFGKSYTWDDGVTVTVGKPQKFKPSAYTVVDKTKRYLRFSVAVVNKSSKPIDLGLAYISVQSGNKQASEVFDSGTSLRGPPDTKVLKGRTSQFEVGFAVTDPKDVVMEVALHEDVERPTVLYST